MLQLHDEKCESVISVLTKKTKKIEKYLRDCLLALDKKRQSNELIALKRRYSFDEVNHEVTGYPYRPTPRLRYVEVLRREYIYSETRSYGP